MTLRAKLEKLISHEIDVGIIKDLTKQDLKYLLQRYDSYRDARSSEPFDISKPFSILMVSGRHDIAQARADHEILSAHYQMLAKSGDGELRQSAWAGFKVKCERLQHAVGSRIGSRAGQVAVVAALTATTLGGFAMLCVGAALFATGFGAPIGAGIAGGGVALSLASAAGIYGAVKYYKLDEMRIRACATPSHSARSFRHF